MKLEKVFQHPTIPQLKVLFYWDHCEDNPKDHFEFDDDVNFVLEQIDNGNYAGWFNARIDVAFHGVTESEYLCCCSYKSFDEFITPTEDYCADMIDSATKQLLPRLQTIKKDIYEVLDALEAQYLQD